VPNVRANTIVFGCGRKGSGKTTLLHERFIDHVPRVISLDVTGETTERFPDAVTCYTTDEVLGALTRAAALGATRWHIAAILEPADVSRLFGLLAPPLSRDGAPSLSRVWGGIAVECSECDVIAPVSGAPPNVLTAFRRGRHHLLSLYMATQRPATCARDVTALADVIFAFAQTEPRDVAWLAGAISTPIADIVRQLPRYHCVYYTREDGCVYVCDEHRVPYRVLDTGGAEWTDR
jgi:hypothetical protein